MEDVIQLLIFLGTIIVFIASAIFKQKKKPAGKANTFENAVESFFGIPAAESAVEQEVRVNIDPSEQDYVSNNKQQNINEEGIDAIPNSEEVIEDNINEEAINQPVFDLRQAIIYKEILNRKTF